MGGGLNIRSERRVWSRVFEAQVITLMMSLAFWINERDVIEEQMICIN
jgi:hypothetical protein